MLLPLDKKLIYFSSIFLIPENSDLVQTPNGYGYIRSYNEDGSVNVLDNDRKTRTFKSLELPEVVVTAERRPYKSYFDGSIKNTLNTIGSMFGLGYDGGKDDSIIQNTAAYNQWRSTLPKNLQTETPDYDLYGAFEAGLEPKWDDKDKSYHLGSRDPRTGRILKRPTHPTFGKAIWSDMSLGYYPIYRDGEIYTEQPIKYVDISKYKGGKDEPWYDKLNDSSVGSIIKLIDPTGVSSYYDVYKAG